MQNPLRGYLSLARRWFWVIILGVVICSGAGYMINKSIKPVYQASTLLVVNLSSTAVPYDVTGSLAIAPTYAQLITSPAVLDPVVANHPGMTLSQLSGMISVKPQSNTQNIELDVQNANPQLAMQLANEISQSLDAYVNTRLSGGLQIVPADLPTTPITPHATLYVGIGALVGLALAIALIILFEWIDDRLRGPDEVQKILELDTLAVIPQLSHKQRMEKPGEVPALAEECRMLCANLNAAQAVKPIKLVMVTSVLPEEGRSLIAVNLASLLAMSGKHVLLVDADMRRPSLHKRFLLDNIYGLSSALQDTWVDITAEEVESVLEGQPTEIPTLRVLTVGVVTSNPAELLQSQLAQQLFDKFKKSQQFDYVILDTPPLLPVADAQILASSVQTAVLVVDASRTPRKELIRAKQILNKLRVTILGVVINKSYWLQDGKINNYRSDVWRRQSKARSSMNMPPQTPPISGPEQDLPHDMNHDMDHESRDITKDITMTLARPQSDRDGKY